MNILINIKNLLISPRFQTLYWLTLAQFAAKFLAIMQESITEIGLSSWAIVGIGLAIATATKALTNYLNNKPMGFAPKEKF